MKVRMMLFICFIVVAMTGCDSMTAQEKNEATIFQIQRLEGAVLEGEMKMPTKVKTYDKSTDAFNEAIDVIVQSETAIVTINFSCTDESGGNVKTVDGMVIETNETIPNVSVNSIGEIAIFQLQITPPPQGEMMNIIYEFKMDGKKANSRFLAIRMSVASQEMEESMPSIEGEQPPNVSSNLAEIGE